MSYSCMPVHRCVHTIDEHSLEDVRRTLENPKVCNDCNLSGVNLWVCLRKDCSYVGCSEQVKDHSTWHYKENKQHCVHMNMTSRRAWCYECDREVSLHQQQDFSRKVLDVSDPLVTESPKATATSAVAALRAPSPSTSSSGSGSGSSSTSSKSGLAGLQNIANTCYMNAALQALSNLEPMTFYFLNYGPLLEHALEQSATSQRCKAGLAKSYQALMYDLWENVETRDYVCPRSLLYGMRMVQPQFRGFQHHDTQEFLRCFMDHLHEELKEESTLNIPVSLINFSAANNSEQQQQQQQQQQYMSVFSHNKSPDDLELSYPASVTPTHSRCSSCSGTEYETADSSISSTDDNHINNNYNRNKPVTLSGGVIGVQSNVSPKLDRHSASNSVSLNKVAATTKAAGMSSSGQGQQEPGRQPSSRSIISDVFDGKILSSVQCLTCNRVSTREETFQDLSLPIPNRDSLNDLHKNYSMSTTSLNKIMDVVPNAKNNSGWFSWFWNWFRSYIYGPTVSLHDCMASFFSADELKGDNMYSCEKCKKLRTGVKFSKILDLPEVLCIHLKRFRHDSSYSSKISSPVQFPLEELDMRQYLHVDCTSKVSLYNLNSVICHHGSVGSGHYICYARNRFTNCWYEFDDHRVSEVSPEVVENCQAYVLFYRKHNPEMELIKVEAHEISVTNPIDPGINMVFYVSSEWLMRFYTFAEPGPINNWAILCPHGFLLHSKLKIATKIVEPISQATWAYLYEKFGGGPAINVLFACEICRRAAEQLSQRRLYELAAFTRYAALETDIESTGIFAISMVWLRKWQKFVRGITNVEPGPITNASICATKNRSEGTTTTPPQSLSPILSSALIHNVRPGSDYAQLNGPQWRLLQQIYGGGPEIVLRCFVTDENLLSDEEQMPEMPHYPEHMEQTRHIGRDTTPEPIHYGRHITVNERYTNSDDYSDTESNIDENLSSRFSVTNNSNINDNVNNTKVSLYNSSKSNNNSCQIARNDEQFFNADTAIDSEALQWQTEQQQDMQAENGQDAVADCGVADGDKDGEGDGDCDGDGDGDVDGDGNGNGDDDGDGDEQSSIRTKAREYFYKEGYKLSKQSAGFISAAAATAATAVASYHIGSNKIKPKGNVFRKRNKRVRHFLKHGDLFGPKGHYSVSGTAFNQQEQQPTDNLNYSHVQHQGDEKHSLETDYNSISESTMLPNNNITNGIDTELSRAMTSQLTATTATSSTKNNRHKNSSTFPNEKVHKKHVRKHLARPTESRTDIADATPATTATANDSEWNPHIEVAGSAGSGIDETAGSGNENFVSHGRNGNNSTESSTSHRRSATMKGGGSAKVLKHENSVTLKKFVQLRDGDAKDDFLGETDI